jgi:GNAT superfamily N-acetyltransferase
MIHLATPKDFPQLLSLQVASITDLNNVYSSKEIKNWIAYIQREGARRYTPYNTYISVVNKEIIGFVSWSTDELEHTAAIECLYVAKVQQGKGRGRRLLQKTEAALPKSTLITVRSTLNARPFYESNGYEHVDDTLSRAGFSISILEKQL